MRNICLKLLTGAAAIAMTGSAGASTIVSFDTQLGSSQFLGAPGPNIDGRSISLTGTATFAANAGTAILGIGDLSAFSVDLTRSFHIVGAPANVFLTATYHFALSDLATFSMTFNSGSPTAAAFTLNAVNPSTYSVPGLNQPLWFDFDSSNSDNSLTVFVKGDGGPIEIAAGNLDHASVRTTSAAPEPASWAMMVGGFGLLGAAMRRRKAAVSFA